MTQINNLVYYDSNSDEDDEDDNFYDTIQGEVGDEFDGAIDDTANDVHGDPINNEFLHPVGQQKGATGMIFEHNGVAYV